MKKVLFAITLSATLVGFPVAQAAEDDQSREAIAKRIKPVGQLRIGDAAAAANAGPRSAEDIYKASCFACHGTGAMSAPKPGDAADWAARSEKGMDAIMANVLNGFNAMPARGTCATCSDDELKAVVDFMLK